ncbi:Protein phosphatase 2C-related domain protein [Candidatus Magnetomorum sp. HK-1]|nr:Protein phosphatase 2C-related domain protein [Candidatus Magnetomorum sp. HK-1]
MKSDSVMKKKQPNTFHVTNIGVTDIGKKRSSNEDFIYFKKKEKEYINKKESLMLVADGMGGHERGAEASKTIIKVIRKHISSPKLLFNKSKKNITHKTLPEEINNFYSLVINGVGKANEILYKRNQQYKLKRYMGSTIVGLILFKNHALWFHVGDSRLYRYRNSTLELMTTDHSAYEKWLQEGKKGKEPKKNIITKAIGPYENIKPDITWDTLKENDIYMLCSDGLTNMISNNEIENILKSDKDITCAVKKLLNSSNAAGGKDNISIILCKVQKS